MFTDSEVLYFSQRIDQFIIIKLFVSSLEMLLALNLTVSVFQGAMSVAACWPMSENNHFAPSAEFSRFPGREGRSDPPDSVVAEDGVASLAFLKDIFAGRKIPGWQLCGLCPAVFRRCRFRWEGRRRWRDPSSVCRASRFFADLEIFISSAHGCGG